MRTGYRVLRTRLQRVEAALSPFAGHPQPPLDPDCIRRAWEIFLCFTENELPPGDYHEDDALRAVAWDVWTAYAQLWKRPFLVPEGVDGVTLLDFMRHFARIGEYFNRSLEGDQRAESKMWEMDKMRQAGQMSGPLLWAWSGWVLLINRMVELAEEAGEREGGR